MNELPMASAFADDRGKSAMDALMESSVAGYKDRNAMHSAVDNALGVGKAKYEDLVALGNVSTFSQDEVYHACPRKWAIKKMKAAAGTHERVNSTTFAFGHAVGAGVACFDETRDLRAAIFACFLAWDVDLLEEEFKGTRKTGKSFYEAVWALYVYRQFRTEETNLDDYEVIKSEATLVIDMEDGNFYVGHVDEILQHTVTGKFLVKENKTTGLSNVDAALYSNSEQALSYAVVIDMLGGQEYEVFYAIYSSSQQEWIQHQFVKGVNKKAEWLRGQLMMNQHRLDYIANDFFPKRGASCMAFMRRCEYYEVCDISFTSVFGKSLSGLKKITSVDEIRAIEHVDYATTISAIVGRQKEKVQHGT